MPRQAETRTTPIRHTAPKPDWRQRERYAALRRGLCAGGLYTGGLFSFTTTSSTPTSG